MVAATALLLAAAPLGDRNFDIRTAPDYGDPRPGLTLYLARGRQASGPQHVCVVGYLSGDGGRQAWVHWREGRRLILWDGSEPKHRSSLIGWGRRDLDLDLDVVASAAAVGASTYLVGRSWANKIIADCNEHGTRYVVFSAKPMLQRHHHPPRPVKRLRSH